MSVWLYFTNAIFLKFIEKNVFKIIKGALFSVLTRCSMKFMDLLSKQDEGQVPMPQSSR